MANTPQNNVGAGAIPSWRTDGIQIANIFEWPTIPTESDLVGRSVSLVYSTDIGGLIYSANGENWTALTSGGDFGNIDVDARVAIGWPYTDPYSISTRLSAFDSAVSLLNTVVGTLGYTNPASLATRVTALEAGGPTTDADARAAIGWPYSGGTTITARLVALEAGSGPSANDTAVRGVLGWPWAYTGTLSAILGDWEADFGTATSISNEMLTLGLGLATKANIASPALTGVPTAPTAPLGTNTTQIATTAFVLANGGGGGFSPATPYTFSALQTFNNGVNINSPINVNFTTGAYNQGLRINAAEYTAMYYGSSAIQITPTDIIIGVATPGASLNISGKVLTNNDIEISPAATAGLILKSANGTRYRLTVQNDGSLTTTAV